MTSDAEAAVNPCERALDLAYRYVDRRERTVDELRAHLTGRGVEESVADQTVAVLQRDGLLDDERFVRLFVEDKRALEDWGTERIVRTLRERGVAKETIDAELAGDEFDGDRERERALALLRRRWPDPPRDPRERERALGVLARKGYDSELALDALNHYVGCGPDTG